MDHSFIEIFIFLILAFAIIAEVLILFLLFNYLVRKGFTKIKSMIGKNKHD